MNDDDVSLFELHLHELDSPPPSDTASATSSHAELTLQDRDLRDNLRLVRALRATQAPADEMRDAHTRVLFILREEMDAGSRQDAAETQAGTRASTALTIPIARRRPIKTRRLARIALVAAALLLLACMAGWQISTAAASALPGSPLYGIKRGEEQLALNMAWSDQRRGEVLAFIADHRLTEMRAEAALRNGALVHSLAGEFDSAMCQLISLTATMATRHENTMAVAASLARELNAEYLTLSTAMRDGDVTLAQALIATVQSEHTAMENSHITLPPGLVGAPVPGAGTSPTARPGPMPTHTPSVGPGNNNGHGNGSNNGNGNGGNNGSGSKNGHSSISGSHGDDSATGDDDHEQSSQSALVGCPHTSICAPNQWDAGFTPPLTRQVAHDTTQQPRTA